MGVLSAEDEDAGDNLSFRFANASNEFGETFGDDNAKFQIVGNELQTAEQFSAAATLDVYIEVVDAAGAFAGKAFSITVNNSTGIGNNAFNNLKVYPNPAQEFIYLEIPSELNVLETSVFVIDLSGKTVVEQSILSDMSGNLHQLDLSGLKSGTYMVILRDQDNEYRQLVIRL